MNAAVLTEAPSGDAFPRAARAQLAAALPIWALRRADIGHSVHGSSCREPPHLALSDAARRRAPTVSMPGEPQLQRRFWRDRDLTEPTALGSAARRACPSGALAVHCPAVRRQATPGEPSGARLLPKHPNCRPEPDG